MKNITKEIKQRILKDLDTYYYGKRYSYEEIFRNSGDYDDYDKNEVWEFTKDYLDLSHADIQQEIKAFELTK